MAMDEEQRRRIGVLERRMDPRGRTFGNLIWVEDDKEVTLVEEPGVVCKLIPINDTLDGSD